MYATLNSRTIVLVCACTALLLALPMPAHTQHHDIINTATGYPAVFPGKIPDTYFPRASTSPRPNAATDYGYFPDHEDMMIVPGKKHFAGSATSSAVIVGRWPAPGGYPYLIENTGAETMVIPLRTREEFDSFIDRLVPRTPALRICPLLDEDWISCDPKPQPPPPAPPPPKPPTPVIDFSWLANSCWPYVCEPPPPPKPPRTTTASTSGLGYCGASVAVCKAYDNTFGRAPEAGQGPAFWDRWLIDRGIDTEDAEFQKHFEAGCQNNDCKTLKNRNDEENRRKDL